MNSVLKINRIICFVIALLLIVQPVFAGMLSTQYIISTSNINYGSGQRSSTNYQIEADVILQQPSGPGVSSNYSLIGGSLTTIPIDQTMTGLFIDGDSVETGSTSVTLNLICSDPSGCSQVSISNNGVSWSEPIAFSTSIDWELTANDGNRAVFIRYLNGNGKWSGVSRDFIELDTSSPVTTISPVSGTFMENPSIVLTANEPASIYYSLDGTAPTTDSLLYSGPVPLTSDTVLKAFAVDSVGNAGAIVEDSYIVCTGSNLSISGVVRDSTVDKGVPLATITLNTGQTTTSDVDGNYSFTGLPRGYYTIEAIDALQSGYITYQKELELCKASSVHDVVLTKASTTFGSDTYAGYMNGSVNTGTGNFTYGFSDLSIPGRGFSFTFERTYNSQDTSDGPLGHGWTHNYNVSLTENTDGSVTARLGDGKIQTWISDDSGGYSPMPGVSDTLVKKPDDTFSIKQKDLIQYQFNALNQLISITDDNDNALTFVYEGNTIFQVIDTSGRVIQFSYDTDQRITRILDPIGRSVTFSYDVNGDQISSTDLGGNTTAYTYNDRHQLLTMTDAMDVVYLTNVYDDQRNIVSSQMDALGGETLYSYNAANKTTQIIDPLGNVSYHQYDDLLRLIRETDAKGHSSRHVYNEQGFLEKVVDKNGNETLFTYDAKGNVTEKKDALGNTSAATYDANNNPLTKTDENGHTTRYLYTDSNLTSVQDALGNTTAYTYDDNGQMLTQTNALLQTTTYEYDQYGNHTATVDAMSNRSEFTYDIVGRKMAETHPLGRSIAYEYDSMDNLISVTDALGGTSSYKYNANGNKTEHKDALGNKTIFKYDAKNRLVSITNPLNDIETYTYDRLDRKISVTNYRGLTSAIGYDEVGNIVTETDAFQNQVRHEYDANGNKTATIDALGNRTKFVYDQVNRLTQTIDALGNATTFGYDANGNQTSVTDVQNNVTSSAYDEMNRLVTVTDPLLNTVTNEYDKLGRMIKVTDPIGRATRFEYDALGRLVKVVDARSGEVTAAYDKVGNRIALTDAKGFSTTYEYDVLNRLTRETDPLSNAETTNYDAVGNILSTTDATGTTTFEYDALNRLRTLIYPDSTSVSYTYDENGNRLSMTDIMGTTRYQYDKLDRIISVTDPFNMTVGYAYNPNGGRSSTIYPGNRVVSYLYDALNRLTTIQDWEGKTTTYQYDNLSRLTAQMMANGSSTSYAYDNGGRLTDQVNRDPANDLIASYNYTLDKIGNRTGLEMEQPLLPRIDFTDQSFSHNDGNQVIYGDGKTFSYDGKGNRIDQTKDAVTTQYAYNFNNRLVRRQKGADIDEYHYNGNGQRLSSVINGVENKYLLDVNGDMEILLAEMDENNNVKKYYIHGDGLLYSIDAQTGQRFYYHYDPLGSTIALSNEQGEITDKYAYLPFGELTNREGTSLNSFTYVGKYGIMLEDNGLYFMKARFYDPKLKTFLSKDLIKGEMKKSQSLNPYIYANNNPINYVDPKGEFALITAALILGGTVLFYSTAEYIAQKNPEKAAVMKDVGSIAYLPSGMIMAGLDAIKEKDWTNLLGGIYPGWNWLRYKADERVSGTNEGGIDDSSFMGPHKYNPNIFNSNSSNEYSCSSNNSESYSTSSSNFDGSSKNFSSSTKLSFITNQNTNQKKLFRGSAQVLNVAKYSSKYFRKEFVKLKDPDLVDSRIQSQIERVISNELYQLQQKRYSYRTDKRKKKQQQRMERDIKQSATRVYANLAKTISKYSVLVQDIEQLPDLGAGNLNRGGVYAR